jgi:hypothetical protein
VEHYYFSTLIEFTTLEFDIAFGNHALHAYPTDNSLICKKISELSVG